MISRKNYRIGDIFTVEDEELQNKYLCIMCIVEVIYY